MKKEDDDVLSLLMTMFGLIASVSVENLLLCCQQNHNMLKITKNIDQYDIEIIYKII